MIYRSCLVNYSVLFRPKCANIWKICHHNKRLVHLEIPDEKIESLRNSLTLKSFDEIFPTIKLPYKLRRETEYSKDFIRYRLFEIDEPIPKLKVEDYEEIYCDLPIDKQQKVINDIQVVIIYFNNVVRNTLFCPMTIPVKDMKNILFKYQKHSARLRYIHFLFVREFDDWKFEQIELKRRELKVKSEADDYFENIGCFDLKTNELQYGYWRNTLFGRYHDKSLQRVSLNGLRQAQLFGQKIIIDCSYDQSMADYETISVGRQISKIYNLNRYSRDPFHLMFCGYKPTYRGYQYLRTMLTQIIDRPEYCFNFYQQEFQELLPNDNLIYLSPDAPEMMTEFDPAAVYIIGALVSKTYKSSMSYEKARKQNIKCLRFPIHKYVELKPGVKKILSIQGSFQILLELKHHGDWLRAFLASIQPHKLKNDDNLMEMNDIVNDSNCELIK